MLSTRTFVMVVLMLNMWKVCCGAAMPVDPPPAAPPPSAPTSTEIEQSTRSGDSAADSSTQIEEMLIDTQSSFEATQTEDAITFDLEDLTGAPLAEGGQPASPEPAGFNMAVAYSGENIFQNIYEPGNYRTTVVVFDGQVNVIPYDAGGLKSASQVTLSGGQDRAFEGKVQ